MHGLKALESSSLDEPSVVVAVTIQPLDFLRCRLRIGKHRLASRAVGVTKLAATVAQRPGAVCEHRIGIATTKRTAQGGCRIVGHASGRNRRKCDGVNPVCRRPDKTEMPLVRGSVPLI